MNATATEPSRVAIALVEEGIINAESAERTRLVVARTLGRGFEEESTAKSRLVEVGGYVGGALVFAAGGIFLVQKWFDLRQGEQIAALGVVAAILAGAAVLVGLAEGGFDAIRTGASDIRRRLAGALFSGAAVAASFMVAEWVDLYAARDVPAMAGSVAMVLIALVGYRLAPTALGQLAILSGASTLIEVVFDQWDHGDSFWVGVALVALAAGWLALAERGVLREQVVGRALGCSWALFGAQWVAIDPDMHDLGYLITAAVALAAFAGYTIKLSWPYVTLGVLSVTLVVPEAVLDWSSSSLGAATGVLLAGIALLAASFAGYRIHSDALT